MTLARNDFSRFFSPGLLLPLAAANVEARNTTELLPACEMSRFPIPLVPPLQRSDRGTGLKGRTGSELGVSILSGLQERLALVHILPNKK